MTSTFEQLVKDFKIGLHEGEEPLQKLFLDKYGIITKNVGKQRVGWDLEIVGFDSLRVGLDKETFDEKQMLDKFIHKFGSTFEVKRDKTSERTGNFYWECWSNFRIRNPGCMLECRASTLVFVRNKEFIFINRPRFLSWIFENLFLRSSLSDSWRKKTFRNGNNKMISAANNPDVLGILIPLEDIKGCPACFHIEPRTNL